MISKTNLLNRLEKLQMLVEKTEEKFGDVMLKGENDEKELFDVVDIELLQDMNRIDKYDQEWNSSCVRDMIIPIMRKANLHWKFRNKLLNWEDGQEPVDWDSFLYQSIDEKCRELALDGNKIAAIKYYRHTLNEVLSVDCGLKQAKERIDSLCQEQRFQQGILNTN